MSHILSVARSAITSECAVWRPRHLSHAHSFYLFLSFSTRHSGTGSVIDMEKKMLAAEVFIAISEAFEKFRQQHEDM